MSATDPIPLDALSDENRAILALLLVQGRSYHEIAELLRLDPMRVRDRAHAAIEALAPSGTPPPSAAARARIADYVVGEQSVSERARTRARLAQSEPERAWATGIALALAPLAGETLPAIPGPEPAGPPDAALAPPPRPPDPDPPAPDRETPSHRGLIAALGLLAAVAGAVILILVLPGAGHHPTRAGAEAGRTIKRLILLPAGPDRAAVGAATIVRPANGGLVLLLRGRGLPANQSDSYAVWLSNRPGASRLLGFISPDVGAAGTFSSGTPLPGDAARFRELIVTLETTSRPIAPGRAVLETQLKLS